MPSVSLDSQQIANNLASTESAFDVCDVNYYPAFVFVGFDGVSDDDKENILECDDDKYSQLNECIKGKDNIKCYNKFFSS